MTAEQQILLVDDRPENLMVLERSLEGVGAELVKANSGESALSATLDRDFALAILDVQMPGMDGYELAELLRGDPKTRHMPIIFLTAASIEDAQIFRGYESGAVDYIVKPFDPVILASKVGVFLEMDQYRRELKQHRDHLDTLVKQRTAEIEEINRELTRSNEELQQFAYVASHDLQEPLRMVASFTQLLAKRYEGKLDEKADMYIEYAVDGARRMQTLITDLLALSRVGTRGKEPTPTESKVAIESVLRDLGPLVEETGAEIVVKETPVVIADLTQLRQVFQNLVGNAIKFRGERPPVVEIDARREGRFWEFRVSDNGIGIEPDYFDRIFVIFQRLHERGKYDGSGMGLSIVKKIVERHGGMIGVESQPGQGTVFHFTMPAVVEEGE